jgi:hypothetical protein
VQPDRRAADRRRCQRTEGRRLVGEQKAIVMLRLYLRKVAETLATRANFPRCFAVTSF